MKKIFKYSLILSFAIVFGGCQDFEVIEKDPNRAVNAPASLVFNGVLNDMYNNVNGGSAWGDKARWNQLIWLNGCKGEEWPSCIFTSSSQLVKKCFLPCHLLALSRSLVESRCKYESGAFLRLLTSNQIRLTSCANST